ncbi:hypothetical protein NPIL_654221 [Nephila pilipes]|uniref:Uncharacterized protein n=1 Tax=Nephila pilipes TaxID=299642 RepID=A0A8X6TFG7_NEPPI|nr:hypothetical protein NPIL_654221 [Nephila pilipes]
MDVQTGRRACGAPQAPLPLGVSPLRVGALLRGGFPPRKLERGRGIYVGTSSIWKGSGRTHLSTCTASAAAYLRKNKVDQRMQ